MDTEDIPDPEAVELDAARATVSTLVERATADVSVAFADDVIAACTVLRNRSMPEFIALEQKLRAIPEFPRGSMRDAMRTRKPEPSSGGPAKSAQWMQRLTYKSGAPEGTEANVITTLVHAPAWAGVIAFDEFANNVIMRKPPPWGRDDAPSGGAKAGPWTDHDDVRLVAWLQREVGMRASVTVAMQAMMIAAYRTTMHPVREYLDALAWDGVPRLGTWLLDYARASKQSEAYLSRVGGWFLISAVARIYEPGCKADHCIILEGAQGAGKSTLVQRLVPQPEWYAVHNANLADKDSYAILQGRMILELAELDSLARQEIGRIKRYMTESTDTYRPVWARRVARFPRHCVFVGTVNDAEYLRDATGNRRFWPVAVGAIDVESLTRDRDQLWAEAVHFYRDGQWWWPRAEDAELLESEQEERVRADTWEEPIARWLQARLDDNLIREPSVRVDQILSGAVKIEIGDQNDGHATRVGKVMAKLQWDKKRVRSASSDRNDRDTVGKVRRVYAYYPPGHTFGGE